MRGTRQAPPTTLHSSTAHSGTALFMHGFPLDHVGIAVPSIAEALATYQVLTGDTGSPPETIDAQGVNVVFLGSVELIEPHSPDTPVGRFLSRRGSGLHHIAYRVPDVAAELTRLAEDGFELIDHTPRPGAGGKIVAFLHPRSTNGVLVELVQRA